mgnify:CR=1 FL=1
MSAVRFLSARRSPPPAHVSERERLLARAEAVAAEVQTGSASRPLEVDLVVAGSGFLSVYFLGVYSVLSRLSRCTRLSGASSGAQAVFELLLTGEACTFDTYLAHGALCGSQNALRSMWNADLHWRALGHQIVDENVERLAEMDGRCFISVAHLGLRGCENAVYSSFGGNPKHAKEVGPVH